jgi:hypothetical protein
MVDYYEYRASMWRIHTTPESDDDFARRLQANAGGAGEAKIVTHDLTRGDEPRIGT